MGVLSHRLPKDGSHRAAILLQREGGVDKGHYVSFLVSPGHSPGFPATCSVAWQSCRPHFRQGTVEAQARAAELWQVPLASFS